MVVHIYNSSYWGDEGRRISSSRPVQAKVRETPSQKQKGSSGRALA
jgi:hypothetical protein